MKTASRTLIITIVGLLIAGPVSVVIQQDKQIASLKASAASQAAELTSQIEALKASAAADQDYLLNEIKLIIASREEVSASLIEATKAYADLRQQISEAVPRIYKEGFKQGKAAAAAEQQLKEKQEISTVSL
jgi:uncharacterized protein involved in exopolysaccharide biosynthesis